WLPHPLRWPAVAKADQAIARADRRIFGHFVERRSVTPQHDLPRVVKAVNDNDNLRLLGLRQVFGHLVYGVIRFQRRQILARWMIVLLRLIVHVVERGAFDEISWLLRPVHLVYTE